MCRFGVKIRLKLEFWATGRQDLTTSSFYMSTISNSVPLDINRKEVRNLTTEEVYLFLTIT
jgi:hypothetical protein